MAVYFFDTSAIVKRYVHYQELNAAATVVGLRVEDPAFQP